VSEVHRQLVRVDERGRIVIPSIPREKAGIKDGDELEFRFLQDDKGNWMIILQRPKLSMLTTPFFSLGGEKPEKGKKPRRPRRR